MDVVENANDYEVSRIAAAIGEPARARILFSLLDGHARTSTELAVLAEVTPSTASVHMNRLRAQKLVNVLVQGKHRYYSLQGPDVAAALEALSVLAGASRPKFVPTTPARLRTARTCYDHLAGALGVAFHDRLRELKWIDDTNSTENAYEVTTIGAKSLQASGVDIEAARSQRRRFAYACLDWSERRPHMGGALAAALLKVALQRKWVEQDLDSRALDITAVGRRELRTRFGISV